MLSLSLENHVVVTMLLVLGSGKTDCQSILGLKKKKKVQKLKIDMKILHLKAEDLILELEKAKQAAIRQQNLTHKLLVPRNQGSL